jgi:hypothetical protein
MVTDKPTVLPNLDDPLVREMADRNHIPTEHWTSTADGTPHLSFVECQECMGSWPCATRQELRQLEKPKPIPDEWVSRYYELRSKAKLTKGERQEMRDLMDRIIARGLRR